MKLAALAFLAFAQSALALDVNFLGASVKITSEKTIEISNVGLNGQNKRAKVQLTWNSVANTFDLSDIATFDVGAFAGRWKTQLQTNCTGAFADYTEMNLKPDGTCLYTNGIRCTWTATGSSINMDWTDYKDYVVTADLVNGEMIGSIVQRNSKWCLKGTFLGP